MPTVNFIGEIESATSDLSTMLCVSWGVLAGSRAWTLRSGDSDGETQTCEANENGVVKLNHPMDIFYETSSSEGWPMLVCEVWDKSEPSCKNFIGCGSAWMPMSPGEHVVDINLWKPTGTGLNALSEYLLPNVPDLKVLREIIVNPYMRSNYTAASTGDIRVKLNVALSAFDQHQVSF